MRLRRSVFKGSHSASKALNAWVQPKKHRGAKRLVGMSMNEGKCLSRGLGYTGYGMRLEKAYEPDSIRCKRVYSTPAKDLR